MPTSHIRPQVQVPISPLLIQLSANASNVAVNDGLSPWAPANHVGIPGWTVWFLVSACLLLEVA